MGVKSSKPKKQRKFLFNMPLHLKRNSLAGHLSKELRKQLHKRSISLRKGDTVKIMHGKQKGKQGKILNVNYKKGIVFIEKIIRKKSDGTEIPLGIKAPNILVLDIASDAKRLGKKKGEKGALAKKEAQHIFENNEKKEKATQGEKEGE